MRPLVRKPAPKQVEGVVETPTGHFVCVRCDNAPEHLRTIFLEPAQLHDAKPGDRVRLEYRASKGIGIWHVIEVLP